MKLKKETKCFCWVCLGWVKDFLNLILIYAYYTYKRAATKPESKKTAFLLKK